MPPTFYKIMSSVLTILVGIKMAQKADPIKPTLTNYLKANGSKANGLMPNHSKLMYEIQMVRMATVRSQTIRKLMVQYRYIRIATIPKTIVQS